VDRRHGRAPVHVEQLAFGRADAERRAPERLTGDGPQRDHDVRLDLLEFGGEPHVTCTDLGAVRAIVDASLATRRPLEVFDRVRDIHRAAVDRRGLEGVVEHPSRGADEGCPG